MHKLRVIHHVDPVKAFPKRGVRRAPARAAAAPALATSWGCTESTTDRAPLLSNAPQVKVVYAYPTNETDDLTTGAKYGDLIQGDAAAVEQRVATEQGSAKTIRFDVGGTGGTAGVCTNDSKNRLDIQTVALQHPASFYSNASDTFSTVMGELRATLAPAAPHQRVDYLVYLDGIAPTAISAAGQGDLGFDTTHGYTNSINQGRDGNGNLFAFVYGYGGADFNGGAGNSSRQETFLHELSHNLGAVQLNAPHSSGAGHCFDEFDIMCYDDDGSYFQSGGTLTSTCPGTAFTFSEQFDCNQDDYFNPSPPAGSTLATTWNDYDSVYLCALADCDQTLTAPTVSLSVGHPNGHLLLTADAGGAAIQHFEWNVNGDSVYETDTGSTPTLAPQFKFPRASQVEVRAVMADGTFGYASVPLAPTDPKPALKATGDFTTGATVTLDGTGTSDPDGLVQRYLWDTNSDGTMDKDTGLTPTVATSYATAGPKQATLEVDYSYGFATTSIGFQIASPPPPVTPVTPVVPTPTPPPNPPTLGVTLVRLKQLVTKGLPLKLTCFASCSVNATLTIDATARKLHLKSKVIGRVKAQFATGTVKPVMLLTASAKRALKRARSLKATFKATVAEAGVSPLTLAKPLSFRR